MAWVALAILVGWPCSTYAIQKKKKKDTHTHNNSGVKQLCEHLLLELSCQYQTLEIEHKRMVEVCGCWGALLYGLDTLTEEKKKKRQDQPNTPLIPPFATHCNMWNTHPMIKKGLMCIIDHTSRKYSMH